MAIERDAISAAPRPGIFYGWWIGLAGTLILIVSSGLGFYGHGVILDPLCQAHGWSKGSVSWAVTLYFLTGGISGMIVGRLIDRFGSRRLLAIGSLLVGAAFVLLSRITALWQLYAVYLLMAVGWSAASLIPVSALLVNWFILKRGRVMSLVTCGLSIGGIVMVPLATYLIARYGLNSALTVLGVIY